MSFIPHWLNMLWHIVDRKEQLVMPKGASKDAFHHPGEFSET
jgi:hypothetical protein